MTFKLRIKAKQYLDIHVFWNIMLCHWLRSLGIVYTTVTKKVHLQSHNESHKFVI